MDILTIGGILLVLMMVLLSGGVWIAMTLAICGWVGQAFFTSTQPGLNLFSAGCAAAVHLDGRDFVSYQTQ